MEHRIIIGKATNNILFTTCSYLQIQWTVKILSDNFNVE